MNSVVWIIYVENKAKSLSLTRPTKKQLEEVRCFFTITSESHAWKTSGYHYPKNKERCLCGRKEFSSAGIPTLTSEEGE